MIGWRDIDSLCMVIAACTVIIALGLDSIARAIRERR